MKSFKVLGLALAAAASMAMAPVHAATWTVETPVVAADVGSLTLNGHTFTFSDPASPLLDVAFYNTNPVPNSQAAIASLIKSSNLFGLTSSTTLTNGISQDSFTGGSITSATGFDYLAVHIGGGELLFHWSSKINSFDIAGASLSNYRAYISPVPEADTYAMLIAGLGLVGFMARRRKQA
jgi:hypothetical protein